VLIVTQSQQDYDVSSRRHWQSNSDVAVVHVRRVTVFYNHDRGRTLQLRGIDENKKNNDKLLYYYCCAKRRCILFILLIILLTRKLTGTNSYIGNKYYRFDTSTTNLCFYVSLRRVAELQVGR